MIDNWLIIDMIKNGSIYYNKGDCVQLFRKKNNGYPKKLDFNTDYKIVNIYPEYLEIRLFTNENIESPLIKVSKFYMCNKSIIRDIKIKYLLK